MNVVSRGPWPCVLVLCASAFGLIGCSDVLGPEVMPVAEVDGRVSQRGKPVTRGWIEFVPVDGTVGKLRSAQLHADGTFRATKVPVGLNLIRFVNIDWDPVGMRRFFGAFTSPIRRTIAQKNNPPVEIDLADEYAMLTRSQAKSAPSKPAPERGEP
jgi:hypothetical protein